MSPDQVICGERVITPEGVRPAAIHIRNGVITGVTPRNDVPTGCPVVDAGYSAVMPGLVDGHQCAPSDNPGMVLICFSSRAGWAAHAAWP